MVLAIVMLCIAIGLLIIEKIIIGRSVTALDLRIHVNGTRGKSSVTEYIAAGLLKANHDVMAKVTGVIPAVIHKGIDQVLGRAGVARVQEQFYIIRHAARKGVKSLVLECMSISPELQQLESRVFKPHIYVITNIKDDHREVMGRTVEEQAASICRAIPHNCKVITNETHFLDLIQETAARKNSTVVVPRLPHKTIRDKLPHYVFPENVSLALAVCEEAGLEQSQVAEGILNHVMQAETPLFSIRSGNSVVNFLNAFSVNDVDSTISFIDHWQKITGYNRKYSVLFNTRADRPLRTVQFAEWIASASLSIEHIFITGTHARKARDLFKRTVVGKDRIHICKKSDIIRIKSILLDTVSDKSLVVGLGNIGGYGNRILDIMK